MKPSVPTAPFVAASTLPRRAKPKSRYLETLLCIEFYVVRLNISVYAAASVNVRQTTGYRERNPHELVLILQWNQSVQVAAGNKFFYNSDNYTMAILNYVVYLDNMLGSNRS